MSIIGDTTNFWTNFIIIIMRRSWCQMRIRVPIFYVFITVWHRSNYLIENIISTLLTVLLQLWTMQEKLRSCYLLMESLIVDPLSSPSLTLSGNHKLPLSPNTVILHYLEENNISNNSIDNTNNTSSRCGHSKFCVERIDLQEHDPNPKRQRRH